jgi:hypothetical protein
MERLERFLGLSVLLTGFSRTELLGTGMADDYLYTLETTLPVGVCDLLLSDWDAQPIDQLLNDPKLGPVARNLIMMWYCGTWTALPDAWRSAYGASPLDVSRVVSAEAYQAGLQWIAIGAHAPGSRQQGFAAWSMPLEGSDL